MKKPNCPKKGKAGRQAWNNHSKEKGDMKQSKSIYFYYKIFWRVKSSHKK